MNDAFHLLRATQEEMTNPANDLGFESLQAPSDLIEFIEFLKSNFVSQGSDEKNRSINYWVITFNYRIGLSEVTSAVFKKSYIDTVIEVLCKFLRDLSLMKPLTIESKNGHAEVLLSHAVVGIPKETVILLSNHLQEEFRLLGAFSDELNNRFYQWFISDSN